MHIKKILWAVRGKMHSLQYGSFGRMSYIGPETFISNKRNVYIGNRVRIYPGIRIELSSADAKLTIEDNVSIGQNVHLSSHKDHLIISKNTTISGNVLITNVDHQYEVLGQHILDQDLNTKKTIIGENCFIGFGAVIQAGTILGKQCIVGANSQVKGEFPDYCVIAGNPARIVKRYNKEKNTWEKTSN